MYKQIKRFFLFVAVFALFGITVRAYAAPLMKITGESSQDEKTIFGQNEIPWLWVNLKPNDSLIEGWWKYRPVGDRNPISYTVSAGTTTIWEPLTAWDWVMPATIGKYNIHLNGYGNKQIHITPEPLSSLLFLFGGAAFAGRKFIKHRRK